MTKTELLTKLNNILQAPSTTSVRAYDTVIKEAIKHIEDEPKWINLTDESFIVGNLPNRKKPCLSIQRGNKICKVASFNDKKSAEEFVKFLEGMFKI